MESNKTAYNGKAQWVAVQCTIYITLFEPITELLPFVAIFLPENNFQCSFLHFSYPENNFQTNKDWINNSIIANYRVIALCYFFLVQRITLKQLDWIYKTTCNGRVLYKEVQCTRTITHF